MRWGSGTSPGLRDCLGNEIAGFWVAQRWLADAPARSRTLGAWQYLEDCRWQAFYKEGLKRPVAGPQEHRAKGQALHQPPLVPADDFIEGRTAGPYLDRRRHGLGVMSDKGAGLDPAGATGFGVRTLVEWRKPGEDPLKGGPNAWTASMAFRKIPLGPPARPVGCCCCRRGILSVGEADHPANLAGSRLLKSDGLPAGPGSVRTFGLICVTAGGVVLMVESGFAARAIRARALPTSTPGR